MNQCKCCTPPTPPCHLTITLSLRNCDQSPGSGISGATVTITGLPGGTVTGTTSGGSYTSPDIPSGTTGTVTVSYGGCSYSQALGCGTLNLLYCASVTTVAIAGPSGGGETLTVAGTVVHDGDSTILGTASQSGSTWTFTYCNISPSSSSATLPASVGLIASSPPNWVPACATISPCCNANLSVTLTLYNWTTCYVNGYLAAACSFPTVWGCCPILCTNPATADHAGLYPKGMQIRWSSSSGVLFASDEGNWINLSIASDVTTCDGSGNPVRTITWSSGCLGFHGNFISLPSGRLNNSAPGDTSVVDYGSVSVNVVTVCKAGGSGITFATYCRWQSGDCSPSPPSHPIDGVDRVADLCTDQGDYLGILTGATCSIVNFSTTYPYLGGSVTVSLREVSCASAISPIVDTGTIDP